MRKGEEGYDVVIHLWEMRSKMMGDEDRFVKGEGGGDMALSCCARVRDEFMKTNIQTQPLR